MEYNKAPPLNTSTSILAEAQQIIYGDREKTYGHPATNLRLIAAYWSAHLGKSITIDDVCLMMILMKAARLANDNNHRDSQVDICGYAALMERVQNYHEQNNPNPAPLQHPGNANSM